MEIMNICMISDNNYTIYLGTLITSILKNSAAEDNFCFHVITEDMTDDNKNKLLQLKEIKNFDIKFYVPRIDRYKSWEKKYKELIVWRYNVFIKLDIPEILKDLDKVLFLDCDMIVLKSLREIFETDINDYLIVATRRYCHENQILEKHFVSNNKLNKNKIKDSFFDDDDLHKFGIEDKNLNEWVNSGFMYMNLKRLRGLITEKDLEEHLIRCIEYKIKFGDEIFFNYFIKNDQIKRIDGKYNVGAITLYDKNFYDDNICIAHYTGGFMPISLPPSYLPIYEKNMYFYKMWEYFVLTPWFKENPIYYINIFNQYDITLLNRKINKIIDFIVWIIPSKKLRDKIRSKIKYEFELL